MGIDSKILSANFRRFHLKKNIEILKHFNKVNILNVNLN